jgi:hypothetical protein
MPALRRPTRTRLTAIEARRPAVEAYAAWLEGEDAEVVAFPKQA